MSRPTPVAIADPALPLPDPADRATYTARKLEHLGWERNVLSPGALALAQVAKDNADDANANAIAVAADAVAVAANAALAAGYAGAAPWVSGSTVAQYAVVSSPINRRSYRKLTTSTGGTKLNNSQVYGSGIIPDLNPGEDLTTLQDSRPHPNLMEFVEILMRDISAGFGRQPEVTWQMGRLTGPGVRFILDVDDRWIKDIK